MLYPISHILTRAIRDDAIFVNGYKSAEPFFATDLGGQGMKAMKVHYTTLDGAPYTGGEPELMTFNAPL